MISRFLIVSVLFLSASSLTAQTSLERGKELLKQGKHREAIGLFRQTIDVSPRNAEAWRLLGEAYLRVGNLDSAEIAAKRSLSIDDERPEAYMVLSDVLLARNNYREAVSTLRRAMKNKAASSALLTHLGFILLRDSVDQAVVAFSQAKEANPNNWLAYEGLGDAYMKQGVPAVAIFQYEKGIEIDSTQPTIYYKIAKAYYLERRYNEAAQAYHRVIALDSTDTNAQFELGKLYYDAKQYGNAARVFKLYVASHPANEEATRMYMESLLMSKQFQDALSVAERIMKTAPRSVTALRVAANAQSELDKHERAIALFQQLRTLDTLRSDDYRRLAKSYIETKRDADASQTLENAIALDSTDLELYSDLGAVYMRLRQWEKAAVAFEKRFQKERIPMRAVSAYVNYAACMMALERWEPARWALRTALSIRPQYVPGYSRLGLSLIALDSLDEAKRVYETVIAMVDTMTEKNSYGSNVAEAYQQIGFILLRQKKYPETLQYLLRSDKLKPNDEQTCLWIAQCYHLMNKQEEAIIWYKKVLKINPKNKPALDGLDILEPK